jgi:hypothetical protein
MRVGAKREFEQRSTREIVTSVIFKTLLIHSYTNIVANNRVAEEYTNAIRAVGCPEGHVAVLSMGTSPVGGLAIPYYVATDTIYYVDDLDAHMPGSVREWDRHSLRVLRSSPPNPIPMDDDVKCLAVISDGTDKHFSELSAQMPFQRVRVDDQGSLFVSLHIPNAFRIADLTFQHD